MAAGVSPRAELARHAGLELDAGAIPVAPPCARPAGLLAAGDVCRADNLAPVGHCGSSTGATPSGRGRRGPHGGGHRTGWDVVPGFWSTIGRRTLKYAAWGDGFDQMPLHREDDGSFVAWYGREGRIAGVLTHEDDAAYERGRDLIALGAQWRREHRRHPGAR